MPSVGIEEKETRTEGERERERETERERGIEREGLIDRRMEGNSERLGHIPGIV